MWPFEETSDLRICPCLSLSLLVTLSNKEVKLRTNTSHTGVCGFRSQLYSQLEFPGNEPWEAADNVTHTGRSPRLLTAVGPALATVEILGK